MIIGIAAIAKVPVYRGDIFVGTAFLFQTKDSAEHFIRQYADNVRILAKQPIKPLTLNYA
jgi:hypothetical protein